MQLTHEAFPIMKHLSVGGRVKVPHTGCSESACLSISNGPDGFLGHCFKCGKTAFLPHADQTYLSRALRIAEKEAFEREKALKGYALPADFSYTIPNAGLAWLGSGGWTTRLIEKYGVGWSAKLGRVVIPLHPDGYVARAVHDDQHPKYLSKTRKGQAWFSTADDRCGKICLVEDILSAGVVGQVCPTIAMLGTSIPDTELWINRSEVVIWTDNDEAGDKCRKMLNEKLRWMCGKLVIDVVSPKDPKRYSPDEIRKMLREAGVDVRDKQDSNTAT